MNAMHTLGLRKADPKRNSTAAPVQSSETSRFGRQKSKIQEILVRNFFRKYPIVADVTEKQ